MSTILLVDDNPSDRALFRALLVRAGYAVRALDRGSEALDAAKSFKPHLIVLDLNLADADGHDICRAVKADPLTRRIPVLMLTVADDHGDVVAGLEAGADDYVAKDEPHQIILARIQRLTRYRQMAEATMLNEQLAQIGRLLAGIVHEIRGPLSVVRGHAELLQLMLRDEEAREWVDPILKSAKLMQLRLTHLMAAVRAGSTRPERARLKELVAEAVDLFSKGLDPRRTRPILVVDCAEDHEAVIDGGKLLLVLLNLLNNAMEAIQAGGNETGRIEVRVESVESEDRPGCRVEVLDDGPGIPPHAVDRLFEPFFTTKENGSGYGLHLSSQILADMGGLIAASNRGEGGARLSLWVPLQPATSVVWSDSPH